MDRNDAKPFVWIIDSARSPLAGSLYAFENAAESRYFSHGEPPGEDLEAPEAVFISAEADGGPTGDLFAGLRERYPAIPFLVVAKVRSLAQAVSFFRAGALDYLSLPLDPDEVAECLDAALDRIARLVAAAVTVELEALANSGEDGFLLNLMEDDDPDDEAEGGAAEDQDGEFPEDIEAEVEAVAVDSLSLPALWEELPCGLLVFDASANLVYANAPAFTLLGFDNLAELQDMLDNRRGGFNALGTNRKPLPDNKWPHIAAIRDKTERHAVVSVARPDKSRVTLRMDCLPHFSDGVVDRMTATLINVT